MHENGTIMIQFGHQVPTYDSSPSDSPREVSGMSEGSLNEQNGQSGNRNGYTKSDEGKMMSALSLGNTDTAYTQPKPDRAHPFVSLGCVAQTDFFLKSNCLLIGKACEFCQDVYVFRPCHTRMVIRSMVVQWPLMAHMLLCTPRWWAWYHPLESHCQLNQLLPKSPSM
jgi:hypothetical protein